MSQKWNDHRDTCRHADKVIEHSKLNKLDNGTNMFNERTNECLKFQLNSFFAFLHTTRNKIENQNLAKIMKLPRLRVIIHYYQSFWWAATFVIRFFHFSVHSCRCRRRCCSVWDSHQSSRWLRPYSLNCRIDFSCHFLWEKRKRRKRTR